MARALGEVIFRRQRRPASVDCHAPSAVDLTPPLEKLSLSAPSGNRRWTPITGGRPSCGCKLCKSLGPNGGRATSAGDGKLSCRLGGRGAAVRSVESALDCCRSVGPSGPIRWPHADCVSRANARRRKTPERRNTSDRFATTRRSGSNFPLLIEFRIISPNRNKEKKVQTCNTSITICRDAVPFRQGLVGQPVRVVRPNRAAGRVVECHQRRPVRRHRALCVAGRTAGPPTRRREGQGGSDRTREVRREMC